MRVGVQSHLVMCSCSSFLNNEIVGNNFQQRSHSLDAVHSRQQIVCPVRCTTSVSAIGYHFCSGNCFLRAKPFFSALDVDCKGSIFLHQDQSGIKRSIVVTLNDVDNNFCSGYIFWKQFVIDNGFFVQSDAHHLPLIGTSFCWARYLAVRANSLFTILNGDSGIKTVDVVNELNDNEPEKRRKCCYADFCCWHSKHVAPKHTIFLIFLWK